MKRKIIILSVLLLFPLFLVQCSSDKKGRGERESSECPDASNPACLATDQNNDEEEEAQEDQADNQNDETPAVCGDGTCQPTETTEACPADCPAIPPQADEAVATSDTIPPTIVSVTPAENEFFVPVHAIVKVTFSEPIDVSSITDQTFRVMANRSESADVVDIRTNGVDLTVYLKLNYNTGYTVLVSAGIKDMAGNTSVEPLTSSFRTWPVPLAGGADHSLALRSGGAAYSWGSDSFGQLGNGPAMAVDSANPVQVISPDGAAGGFLADIVAMAGYHHSLVVASDGSVYSWGLNTADQLGSGGVVAGATQSSPIRVVAPAGEDGILSEIVAVAAGQLHSLALTRNGKVYAWGSNTTGQLGYGGIGGNVPIPTAVDIPEEVFIVAIAAGSFHSVALASDGTVFTWGADSGGQLGDGTSGDSGTSPIRVVAPEGSSEPFLSDIVAIAAGWTHTLALTQAGNIYSWGVNLNGELGVDIPFLVVSAVPVRVTDTDGVGALSNIVSIACGFNHSMALTTRGEVLAWGGDLSGQLGDGIGGPAENPLPRQVVSPLPPDGLSKITGIAAGAHHSMAIDQAGDIYTWGNDGMGQLGDGTIATPLTDPVPNLVQINP